MVAALLLAGCSDDDNTVVEGDTAGRGATTVEGSATDYLGRPEVVPGLIRAKFGEAPSVRRIHLFHDSVLVEVRDPAKPENLDDWTYRDGEWTSRPVSVSMSDIEALDDTTFQPGQVAWDAIPDLVDAAFDGLDLEEEGIDAVSYDRLAGDPPRVYIGVTGLRGNGRLIANADGTEVDVQRN